MRILLVAFHEQLGVALSEVLNPENEYCAIVTDEIKPAKIILDKIGFPANLLRPMYELKECISSFYYDCLIFVSDSRGVNLLPEKIRAAGLPKNKFVHIYLATDGNNPFMIARAMNYYEEHAADFEMFATGMSYTSFALDSNQFKYKLFNFGRASQDLYYDYQIAKFVLKNKKRGGVAIRADWACAL